MKRKGTLVAGLVGLACIAVVVIVKHQAARESDLRAKREAALARTREITSPIEKGVVAPATGPLPSTAVSNGKTEIVLKKPELAANVKTQEVAQAKKPPAKPKDVKDPLAREALILVGLDPDAEQYWFAAIHNPTLPTSERQDLIDDLNEEGLPDPKHPTLDDLPLILSRIEILEELVPSLTDEFDWKEPYDDLLNLADVAMGGGKPVD